MNDLNDLDEIKTELNKKIEKIEDILNNNKLYNEYIENVDQKYLNIPDDVILKIKEKLNYEKYRKNCNKENVKKKNSKYKMFQITKIAASAIFAILIWNSFIYNSNGNFKNTNIDKTNKVYDIKQSKFYLNIDNKMKDINGFLLNPIESKGVNKL